MKKYFIVAILFLAVASRSFGAGMTAHMYMSDVALQRISDPELKKILNDNRDAVLAGTIFPDSGNGLNYTVGYSKKDNYAEVTHWHPFLEAYLNYIKSNCQPPYSGHCRELIAHFMGTAAHNLEDGTSHYILYRIDERMDPTGAKTDMDMASDFILIEKYRRGPVLPKYVVPYDDLMNIFKSMGLNYTKQGMIDGNRVHRGALFAERVIARSRYETIKRKNPWIVENIITAPGGIDYSGQVTAGYWDALWQRLNGKEPADMVLATYPGSGELNIDPATELFLMFTRPMQGKTINTSTVVLQDRDRKPVETVVKRSADQISNLTVFAIITPKNPLQPEESYSAALTTGILDLNGKALRENYSWKFTTAPVRK